jgi:nucleotide-binding universal stress UspA family protein
MSDRFPVVIATDGSPESRAALAVVVGFPWPPGATVAAVVARSGLTGVADRGPIASALDRATEAISRHARRALGRRWPEAPVAFLTGAPAEAILAEARRRRARVIVVAPRPRGRLSRLFLGSVTRAVVRRAPCAVLVARGRARRVRRLVIGLDGSRHARRAVDLVAALTPPAGGRVTLVAAVEPVRVPSTGLLPASARDVIRTEAARLEAERVTAARVELDRAAASLAPAGWAVGRLVRTGVPLPTLLDVAARADLLVLGARGIGALEGLLLGSVADGAVSQAPGSVLIAR